MSLKLAYEFLGISQDADETKVKKVIEQKRAALNKELASAKNSDTTEVVSKQLSQLDEYQKLIMAQFQTADVVSAEADDAKLFGDLAALQNITMPTKSDSGKKTETEVKDSKAGSDDLLGDLAALRTLVVNKPIKKEAEPVEGSTGTNNESQLLDDLASLGQLQVTSADDEITPNVKISANNADNQIKQSPKESQSGKKSLLQQLNIDDSMTASDALKAIDAQIEKVKQSISKAPTEILKKKFRQQHEQLTNLRNSYVADSTKSVAPKVTTSKTDALPKSANKGSQTTNTKSRAQSPGLTQTKMADLPMSGTQFDGAAQAQLTLDPGTILADRYEVIEQIGSGGMGAVFAAYDKNREQNIAIKVLLPSLLASPIAKERFLDEARLSSELSHPNVVNVFDVQTDGDFYFITMELLEGQNLRQYLENLKIANQDIRVEDAIKIVDEICDGLAHAHEITVHRDIKPENIWITGEGKVKIMDFGIARVMSSNQMTKTGAAMGTAYYMAPEQLQGRTDIDGRADQYAVGVLFYEMLTRQIPAGRIESVHKLRKDVGKKLSLTIDKMLSGNAESRFESMAEVKNALVNKGGVSLPSLPSFNFANTMGMVAASALVVVALGVSAYTGHLQKAWDLVRPYSQEEVIAFKAEAADAEAKIKSLGKRLDDIRGEIKDQVRELKFTERQIENNMSRESSSDRKASERKLAEIRSQINVLDEQSSLLSDYILDGEIRGELNGKMNLAKELLRDKTYQEAIEAYRAGLTGYENLVDQAAVSFNLAKFSLASKLQARQWDKIAPQYNIKSIPYVDDLKQKHDEGERLLSQASFVEAEPLLDEVWQGYEQAIYAIQNGSSFKTKATKAKASWEKYANQQKVNTKYTSQYASQFNTAESQWSAGDIVPASKEYTMLYNAYVELENAARNASSLKSKVRNSKSSWDNYRKQNNMVISLTDKYAKEYNSANKNFSSGQIVDAAKSFSDLDKAYRSLLSSARNVNQQLANANQSKSTWESYVSRGWARSSRATNILNSYNQANKLRKSGSWTDAANTYSTVNTQYQNLNKAAVQHRDKYLSELRNWEKSVANLEKDSNSYNKSVSNLERDVRSYRSKARKDCYDGSVIGAFAQGLSAASCELGCTKNVWNGTYYEMRTDQYCINNCRNRAADAQRKKDRAIKNCESDVKSAQRSLNRSNSRLREAKSNLSSTNSKLRSKKNSKPSFTPY